MILARNAQIKIASIVITVLLAANVLVDFT
jgi:hypothetical protein